MTPSGARPTDSRRAARAHDEALPNRVRARQARDLSPETDRNWVTLAEVHLREGNRAEASVAARKAVELNPANRSQLPLTRGFQALKGDPKFEQSLVE